MSILSKIPASRLLTLPFFFFVALQVNHGQSIPDLTLSTPLNKVTIGISIESGNMFTYRTPFFTSIDEEGNVFKATKAFSIEYGWQMLGEKEWHQTCKYPHLGIGVQYLRVMKRDELGHPVSVYGFYNGNYLWSNNFQFTNRLAAGLAYGFTAYNPNDLKPNDLISTKVNAFVELGTGFAIRLSDFLFIEPGFRFTHFSNGNIREPQKGINIVSYNIGARSILGSIPTVPKKIPVSECQHRHEVLAFLGMATRQLEFKEKYSKLPHETYGLNYLMANLHLGYNYEMNHRLKLGGGVDIIHDGTNGQQEVAKSGIPHKSDVPFHDKMGLSVFIGGESAIDRLSIVTSLGYMVAQTRFEDSSPAFEQRLGFKYHFYRNVFAGVNVRAYNFRAAKAFEFNIGMRKFL
ncbi:MAG: acyloxyacyl hydrolase [Bacteroidetes bacterium]|nr:acyloxyacyl hydrolase [Bacteroidota bacterium]